MMAPVLTGEQHRKWIARAGVLALVAYFIAVGFTGIDFGSHWDEWYQPAGMRHAVETLTWLPQLYGYNGLYFLLGLPFVLAKAAPHVPGILRGIDAYAGHSTNIDSDLAKNPAIPAAKAAMRQYVDSHDYVLDVRRADVVLSSLAIVWVYLAVRALVPRHRVAALGAAAFIALSWEVGYHARFIAVDDVVMQFLALELFASIRAWRALSSDSARRWTLLSAIAAGCALAGKSTAVFAVLPVLALALRPGMRPIGRLRTVFSVAVATFATVFILSPGTFIDPLRFLATMSAVRHDYNDTGADLQYPNLIASWPLRVFRAGEWLLAVVPSPAIPLACALSAVALLGWWSRVRREGPLVIWTGFSLVYVGFITLNKLFIVRNFLMVVPFLATMFGLGVARLAGSPRRRWRWATFAVVSVAFACNAVWGMKAALTIKWETPLTVLEHFRHDRESAGAPFRISSSLSQTLGPDWTRRLGCRPVAAASPGDPVPEQIFLFHREPLWTNLINNRPYAIAAHYGSLEVNYDWYMTFRGKMQNDRIVGLRRSRAEAIGLDMSKYLDCAAKPGQPGREADASSDRDVVEM